MPLSLDLSGKTAFIAGIGDDKGYGWAIAKALAEAGAKLIIGTWPPIYKLFMHSIETGKLDASLSLSDGSPMTFHSIYPFDAMYDSMDNVPEEVQQNKRYREYDDYSISGVAKKIADDVGTIDILVHSLANGPEVKNPLLSTSREGYLAALSASSYSFVSMLSAFGDMVNTGGSALSLTYIASERVVPGYGGGMSSAKAALESDTRTLAWEAGKRWGIRVNTISAGPLQSRAAKAIGFIEQMVDYSSANSPLCKDLSADEVGHAAAFLLSPFASAITGATVYVDNGLNIMGLATDSISMQQ